MGIHSGPVSGVVDVNGRTNVAGSGINLAQRVMDCGDAIIQVTEYLPSATGPFPLLRCFGRGGRPLLVTHLGKSVGQQRV